MGKTIEGKTEPQKEKGGYKDFAYGLVRGPYELFLGKPVSNSMFGEPKTVREIEGSLIGMLTAGAGVAYALLSLPKIL